MKYILTCLLVLLSFTTTFSQNYYEEYPIAVSIATNNGLHRMEFSTFDSSLQTIVNYNTPWITSNFQISGYAYGKIAFTTWLTPTVQNPLVGFVIYDHMIHQFSAQLLPVDLSGNRKANVVCGKIWVTVANEFPYNSSFISNYDYYRYNILNHSWAKVSEELIDNISTIWNFAPKGNEEIINAIYDQKQYYFDPVFHKVNQTYSNCDGEYDLKNDYMLLDQGCGGSHEFYAYDAETHIHEKYPKEFLAGALADGICTAVNELSDDQKFFFIYDQAIHQWITDSVYSDYLTNIQVNDRVIAYIDSTSGFSKKVFYMVFNPVLHTWVKDSSAVSGYAFALYIQNGTVRWNDGNGVNIRGFDINTGWGNYNTSPFLYFHLTDFSSQGFPMVHVRNYSIGIDSAYYDFGDGVVSLDNRHVIWHAYKTSGTYNICIYNSSGPQSFCQPVIMNICSSVSAISFAADTICQGDTSILSITNVNGTIQWQSKTDSVWVDETAPGFNSPAYGVSPDTTTKYRAIITNGTCIPALSNEQTIKVYQIIQTGYVADTVINKCSGHTVMLKVMNSNGNYQWQVNNGTSWNNLTNGNNNYYNANTQWNALYRVIISSGPCFADTSEVISVTSDTVPPMPVLTPDFTCGPGVVDLLASSSVTPHWYLSTAQDSIINIGNSYSPFINATTTYKVKSAAGVLMTTGYYDNTIGTVSTISNQRKGIRFYCAAPAVLEDFEIYPMQSGIVQIKLYRSNSEELAASLYKPVTAGSGSVKVSFGALLQGNITYDLIVEPSSVPLQINTGGASYPINTPGNPITILGYVDSVFHDTTDFYNFYNITITTGCKSNSSTVTGTMKPAFTTAAIVPSGPLSFCQGDSVKLNTFPSTGISGYQWLRNGTVFSTSGNSYTAHTPGLYKVIMLNTNNCYDTSAAVQVSVPCIPVFDSGEKLETENETAQFFNYYDHASGMLSLTANLLLDELYTISIIDQSGREINIDQYHFTKGANNYSLNVEHLSAGLYVIKLQSESNRVVKRWIKY